MDELENDIIFEFKKDLKKLIKSVRKKNGSLTYYESENGVDMYEYIFKALIRLDKRLDDIEAKFDEIDKAFKDSLERFPA